VTNGCTYAIGSQVIILWRDIGPEQKPCFLSVNNLPKKPNQVGTKNMQDVLVFNTLYIELEWVAKIFFKSIS